MIGIAISPDELPVRLLDSPAVKDRLYRRAGMEEVRFYDWQRFPVLPVRWEGAVQLVRWGCRDRRSAMPYGSVIAEEHVAAGVLSAAYPERVVVPGHAGHVSGMWFLIHVGVAGVVVRGESGAPVVYLLTQPATNVWRNAAGQLGTMPILIDQVF